MKKELDRFSNCAYIRFMKSEAKAMSAAESDAVKRACAEGNVPVMALWYVRIFGEPRPVPDATTVRSRLLRKCI